jgi:hypothetical protein
MPTPTYAAQVIITIIPIVGIVAAAAVIFLFLLLRHKQIVRMIEKGGYQRMPLDLLSFCLLAGLILLAIGLPLSVFFLVKDGLSYDLLGGIIPLSLGIGLTAYYVIIGARGA